MKIALEILGGFFVLAILIVIVIGVMLNNDYESGNNPFE